MPPVNKADMRLLEPYFGNPNSHKAVRVLLRKVGKQAGLEQYGGTRRSWLAIECDGLPNTLLRHVIHEAQQKAHADAKAAAGIPDVHSLSINEIKEELQKAGFEKKLSRGER